MPLEPDPVTRPAIGLDQFAFPMQPGKVQRPLLPESTLRRDRLLGWLEDHSDRRLIYVIAEAGFGKTTLVADYLRRSRFRTFWYRLDDGDTDGLVFLRYFIAACRAVDDRLLRRAAALVSEASIEPLRQETVLEAALAEIGHLGDVPSMLVLDDFHTAEASTSLREVVERLIARAPAKLGITLVARRTPMLSVAAARARGELAELPRDALRFEESETARLFDDSYRDRLDPEVIRELQARTDGWAASIGLVRTAVEGRTPGQVRAFVSSLSGAEGSLYDYVAEEVVGELPADLRRFLLRVVLLEEIDIDNAALAAGVSTIDARRLIAEAQRLSLLARGDGLVGAWRAHPLVRDFLVSHLEVEVGREGVAAIHRHLAGLLERTSWRLAARHWAAAGEAGQVRRVICAAVPAIIGTGDLTAAADLISRFPDPGPNPWYDIIRSRQSAAEGRYDEALTWARQADGIIGATGQADPSLVSVNALNTLFLGIQAQRSDLREAGVKGLAQSSDPELASIARSAELQAAAAVGGSLDRLVASLLETARLNAERGHTRHHGISLLNLTLAELVRGRHASAAEYGRAALASLGSTASPGDRAAARVNLARAVAHLTSSEVWEAETAVVLPNRHGSVEPETIAEIAELHAMYGDPATGSRILRQLYDRDPRVGLSPYCRQVEARLEMLRSDGESASRLLADDLQYPLCAGFSSAVASLRAQVQASFHPLDDSTRWGLETALEQARSQQAWFWWRNIALTRALISDPQNLIEHISALAREDAALLSIQAELVLRKVTDLDEGAFEVVRREAELRPERWRWALRRALSESSSRHAEMRRWTELLELVGEADDVRMLRSLARRKTLRIPDAGRVLSRRLALPVHVEDLGRVKVRIGDRLIPGTDIRRKVLALLTYLITRPQFAASREQVVEALWPEMAPEQGANSLNQTAYFLRRVFEPGADDDTSAGYLSSRGDLIWLDPELVTSQSSVCLDLIAKARRNPSPDVMAQLAESYTGRFAIDFTYDDWAASFRESLHASFLDRIERALDLDIQAGAFHRAVPMAQLALQTDPEADQIELKLLHLYRVTGAHAAAAELYAHYSTTMREQLGVEPPPLESI